MTSCSQSDSPRVDQNAINGLQNGQPPQPSILTYASLSNQASAGWYNSPAYTECWGLTGGNTGNDCDEYPYRSTHEGGPGASLRPVPSSDNQGEGNGISSFYPTCGITNNDGKEFAVVPMTWESAPATFYYC